MQTMVRIGCSKGTVAMLLIWELAIVFAIALGLVLLAVLGLEHFAAGWIESLLMRENR
jgi:hypothetical protein